MRSVRLPLAVALLAVFSLQGVPAQPGDKADPIDKALRACLATDRGQSTAGMVECLGIAHEAWDRELNRTYDQLMRSLDQASRDKLRAAQRQWLVFRDADMAFQRQEFVVGNGKYGTLAGVTLTSDNVETIRRRVMTLRAYLGPD
jgi:uncharacterized protein YecT (DUF1311 family)